MKGRWVSTPSDNGTCAGNAGVVLLHDESGLSGHKPQTERFNLVFERLRGGIRGSGVTLNAVQKPDNVRVVHAVCVSHPDIRREVLALGLAPIPPVAYVVTMIIAFCEAAPLREGQVAFGFSHSPTPGDGCLLALWELPARRCWWR